VSKLALESLRQAIGNKLVEIEDVIKGYGIHLPELTLIARDPTKPGMVISLSSEKGSEMGNAFIQAARAGGPSGPAKPLKDMDEADLKFVMMKLRELLELGASALGVEKPLFALVLFNDPAVAQYMANCERSDMIKAMRETADRLERNQDVRR
jgi:hypothetical protein